MQRIPGAFWVLPVLLILTALAFLLFPHAGNRREVRLPDIIIEERVVTNQPPPSRTRLSIRLEDVDHAISLVSKTDPKTIIRIAGVLEQSGFRNSRDVVDTILGELDDDKMSEAMRREISRQFRASDLRKSLQGLRSNALASAFGVSMLKSICLTRLEEYRRLVEKNPPDIQ